MDSKDMQRWSAVAAGGLLAAVGAKKGGRNGILLALAGGALGVLAYMKLGGSTSGVFQQPREGGWRIPKERLMEDAKSFGHGGRHRKDRVHEASEESFPASDSPSFTPNTSIGSHEN